MAAVHSVKAARAAADTLSAAQEKAELKAKVVKAAERGAQRLRCRREIGLQERTAVRRQGGRRNSGATPEQLCLICVDV